MALLITGGRLVTGIDSYHASVLVEDGRIAKVGRDLVAPPGAEVLDVAGKLILPGVVDAHVHAGLDAGGHRSSDFRSTTRAAAFGGVTTVLTYATPEREQTLLESLAALRRQADGHCHVDYGVHVALVRWDDRDDDEVPALVEAGVPSFKMYTAYSARGLASDDEQIYHALLLASKHGALVEVHCESEWIIDSKVKRLAKEKRLSPADFAASRPGYAEAEAVAGVLRAAYSAGAPVYIVHVSAAESVDAIEEASDIGLEVYAETCPQFLLLDQSKLAGKDGQRYAACPPLRRAGDQAALWDALDEGLIQVVATDHCEFAAADKDAGTNDFRKIPMGLPGVGTLLPLMWHFGVGGGKLRENELVDRLSTQPAEIFGLHPRKGSLSPGSDADLIVFDPDLEVIITPEALHGHADYSPYDGCAVKGWPVSTMVRGHWVVKDRELVGSHELGSFVERGRVCRGPGAR
ncbi:MAG: dihydropyrimidinase [Candidatus Eisenbacteria bacterium]|nr:dihydropyrimidinase [Candidatus Eisenbacteria bacterium]